MATNYISPADFDAIAGGSTMRQKLYTPAGGTYSSTDFERASQLASSRVRAAALSAGYEIGETTSSDAVILAAVGYLATMAFGRNTEKVPTQFHEAINIFKQIDNGELRILGVSPTVSAAVGGAKFTGIDANVSTDHPQIFNRASRGLY